MNSLDTWNIRVYELDSIFTTIFKDKEAGAQLLKVTMAEDVSCLTNIYSSLLPLSRFSRVRLCETPWTAAHQALPSLGFSRQEHWSGLPFPSPMHESEKRKWSRSVVSNS